MFITFRVVITFSGDTWVMGKWCFVASLINLNLITVDMVVSSACGEVRSHLKN